MDAVVRAAQPADELTVEAVDIVKAPADQEAAFVVVVGALDHAFGFRVARAAQSCAHPQRAAERLELARQRLSAGAPLADAAFLVPHRAARHRAELLEHAQHPRQHVMARAGRDHPAAVEVREAGRGRHDPELVGLAEPEWDLHIGLPQIPLRELTRRVRRALTRIRRHEQRPQLTDPVAQDRDPPIPADPFRDHRRRHRRELAQQLADLRLDRVHRRSRTLAFVTRWLIATQRLAHRVARHVQAPHDRFDAQPLRAMQPTDLGPVLHVDHAFPPRLASKPGSESQHSKWWTRPEGGQFSTGDKGSVFNRWRQRGEQIAHPGICRTKSDTERVSPPVVGAGEASFGEYERGGERRDRVSNRSHDSSETGTVRGRARTPRIQVPSTRTACDALASRRTRGTRRATARTAPSWRTGASTAPQTEWSRRSGRETTRS